MDSTLLPVRELNKDDSRSLIFNDNMKISSNEAQP